MSEMAQIDYNSGMRKARTEGEAAIAIGMGMDADTIVKITGLTLEEIEGLRV